MIETTYNSGLASASPFPLLPESSHSRDPHGLNAYLLHPEDGLWDYLEPAPARKAAPLAVPPPVPAPLSLPSPTLKKQKSFSLFKKATSDNRRSLQLTNASRSHSAVSSISSNESDGVKTPKDETSPVLGNVVDAFAASQDRKMPKSKSWIGWIGKKRKEVVQLEEDEEPTVAPALRVPTPLPEVDDESVEMLPIHHQLRAMSLRKLAALKAPSPHPLAEIFNQQLPFAPRRRSRAYPASTNTASEVAAGGERIRLLVKLVHDNASSGRRIDPDVSLRRSSAKRSQTKSSAGMSAFLSRPAFEERMQIHYPTHTSIITPAREHMAVAEIEFSPHLYALAEATGGWKPSPLPQVGFGLIDEIEVERAVEVAELRAVEEAEVLAVEKAPDVEAAVLASQAPDVRQALAPPVVTVTPAAPPTPSRAGPSFRSSFITKPVAPTWADSSEDEESEDDADSSDDDEDEPLASVAKRHSLVFPPVTKVPLKPSEPVIDLARVEKEQKREAERQRRYREEVERTRARRESARRGEVERKVGMDAAGRPSASTSTSRSRSSLPSSSRPPSTHTLSAPPLRNRTSSYAYPAPPIERRSQSFYEMPRVYAMPVYPMAPPRAMSMVYPAYIAPSYPVMPPPRPSRRPSHLPIQ